MYWEKLDLCAHSTKKNLIKRRFLLIKVYPGAVPGIRAVRKGTEKDSWERPMW
jgi:hypothetical protein